MNEFCTRKSHMSLNYKKKNLLNNIPHYSIIRKFDKLLILSNSTQLIIFMNLFRSKMNKLFV